MSAPSLYTSSPAPCCVHLSFSRPQALRCSRSELAACSNLLDLPFQASSVKQEHVMASCRRRSRGSERLSCIYQPSPSGNHTRRIPAQHSIECLSCLLCCLAHG
ncbi:hypothetical protein OIU84_003574 [Salix udensis]|uniref:Uncharacterized protein n=1 Tax=Salix udensis TaxID=889485 RepID=A0AAD6P301_9ROSI|nr:hypothetical protein OIU84_003574 [Salix udensis]